MYVQYEFRHTYLEKPHELLLLVGKYLHSKKSSLKFDCFDRCSVEILVTLTSMEQILLTFSYAKRDL